MICGPVIIGGPVLGFVVTRVSRLGREDRSSSLAGTELKAHEARKTYDPTPLGETEADIGA